MLLLFSHLCLSMLHKVDATFLCYEGRTKWPLVCFIAVSDAGWKM